MNGKDDVPKPDLFPLIELDGELLAKTVVLSPVEWVRF
jgi:hypothetical protein